MILYTRIFRKIISAILVLVGLAIASPIFICDQFRIKGVSMSPTLESGDHILVFKPLMGARLYTSYDFSKSELACFRLPGVRDLRPGDIAVFNNPKGRDREKIEFRINHVYAKRCIGCPGDTVSIENGFYWNSRMPGTILGDSVRQQQLRDTPDSVLSKMGVYLPAIPYSHEYEWTIRNFGPLPVPQKGMHMEMDTVTVKQYRRVIEYETGFFPEIRAGAVYVGDEVIKDYVFQKNWYFFGGDNVFDSKDSRYIGFVPEDYIVGIAVMILCSRDPYTGQFLWNRFMKRID